ncbi:MAG: hypothetical protein U0271_18665 [Polyangiaceae bacterium]
MIRSSLLPPFEPIAQPLRMHWRRFRARFGLPGVRLLHDLRYTLPSNDLVDGRRGERVIRYLIARRYMRDREVDRPRPLSLELALRVHSVEYLASLDNPAEIARIFATEHSTDQNPAAVLEAQRWATAGTVEAAMTAHRYPWITSPVVNLGGGFHHARRTRGAGFCALNDVAIAIAKLRAEDMKKNILVVDLDLHHGDGTRSIFADDPTVYTYSVHNQSWDDSPAVASLDVELGPGVGDQTYLRAVRDTLPEAFERAQPGFVFYVAGADPAATDVLGDWRISADAMAERDRMVFERTRNLPTVMVLAGGYGPNAWRYPARTIAFLQSSVDTPIPTIEERSIGRFRSIRQSLADGVLRGERDHPERLDDLRITEEDIYGDLFSKVPDKRLLGFYSTFGLELAFEQYGLAKHLRERGYEHFFIDPEALKQRVGHGVRVYGDATKRDVLIELVLSDFVFKVPASAEGRPALFMRLLCIEWLLLQDPRKTREPSSRGARSPLLPGQKHPGLGCLSIVIGMLIMACERLGYDGITVVPAHFHVAAQARRLFTFLEPEAEAYYLALARATSGLPLDQATIAVGAGRIIDKSSGEPAPWRPARMVLPISDSLKGYLASKEYEHRVEDAIHRLPLERAATSD